MKKAIKIWLIIAAALMLAGFILLGGVMAMIKWDFTKLSTTKYETREYNITESFENISVMAKTADVVFVPAEGTECRVVCYEQTDAAHTVAVREGVLTIEWTDTRGWMSHIGFNFQTPKITVYMPAGAYDSLTVKSSTGGVNIPSEFSFESVDISLTTGFVTCKASVSSSLSIQTSTGAITLQDVSAGSLDLTVTTGKVTATNVACAGDISIKVNTGKSILTDVTCQSLISTGSTGDITLKNVIAAGKFSIERSTGDVTLDACDAVEISVTTDTGDVTGTLLTDKTFFVETDTGRREYPHMTTGGKCEITTDTGDIKISIKK